MELLMQKQYEMRTNVKKHPVIKVRLDDGTEVEAAILDSNAVILDDAKEAICYADSTLYDVKKNTVDGKKQWVVVKELYKWSKKK
jgi:DNA-directed RNA polymerase subunit L